MEPTSNSPAAPFASIEYHYYPKRLKPPHLQDTIVPSNMYQRGKLGLKKHLDAWTTYTAKGFTGSKDANFYEFLAMGSIPYILGSITMIAMPNLLNHKLPKQDRYFASKFGLKAGLGVLFYGLAKTLSRSLVEKPVKWTTGVDLNLPYIKYSHELPTAKENDPVRKEGHYVYESIEFPRTDRLANYEGGPDKANVRFDKIARKMGYKEKLPDSDQIVKPKIREITTKTKTVTYITQYLWAALGVALAIQRPWERFVSESSKNTVVSGNSINTLKQIKEKLSSLSEKDTWKKIGNAFKDSVIELYKGGIVPSKADKYSGKALIISTLGLTTLGTAWVILSSKQKDKPVSSKYKIDESKEFTVT